MVSSSPLKYGLVIRQVSVKAGTAIEIISIPSPDPQNAWENFDRASEAVFDEGRGDLRVELIVEEESIDEFWIPDTDLFRLCATLEVHPTATVFH